jgi:hypothetical protein
VPAKPALDAGNVALHTQGVELSWGSRCNCIEAAILESKVDISTILDYFMARLARMTKLSIAFSGNT